MALTTLLDYKTAVKAEGYDGSADATLLAAINEARRDVARDHRWSWLEAIGNTTLVLAYDTPSEALNGLTDVKYVDAARLEFGTEYLADLTPLPTQQLRTMEHVDRTPGQPRYYTIAAGQLRVYPSPDKAYTVSLDYTKTITNLAADADPDDFIPVDLAHLVKWKACAKLAFRQRDTWAQPVAENNYLNDLRRAVAEDNMRQRQQSDQVASYWGRTQWPWR